MHLAAGTVAELRNARVPVMMALLAIAAFWRTIIRMILAIIAAAALIALGFGVVMLFQTMH
jgi:hypothetical protein